MTSPDAPAPPDRPDRRALLTLVVGAGAVLLAMAAGSGGSLGVLLQPPFPLGLLAGAAAGLLALVVGLRAAARIGAAHEDPRELIRAIRLVFVAVGCLAAAAGWIIGSPVPIVAGLIIIGIDVIETTFLMLVTAVRREPGRAPER
jgi:hypothetical protein